jgi:hypothetical protein
MKPGAHLPSAAYPSPAGMTGNKMCDGRSTWANTRFRAMRGRCHEPPGSPEFGLTSKCGKLLLKIQP